MLSRKRRGSQRSFLLGFLHVLLEGFHVVREEQEGVVQRQELHVFGIRFVFVVLAQLIELRQELFRRHHLRPPRSGRKSPPSRIVYRGPAPRRESGPRACSSLPLSLLQPIVRRRRRHENVSLS